MVHRFDGTHDFDYMSLVGGVSNGSYAHDQTLLSSPNAYSFVPWTEGTISAPAPNPFALQFQRVVGKNWNEMKWLLQIMLVLQIQHVSIWS